MSPMGTGPSDRATKMFSQERCNSSASQLTDSLKPSYVRSSSHAEPKRRHTRYSLSRARQRANNGSASTFANTGKPDVAQSASYPANMEAEIGSAPPSDHHHSKIQDIFVTMGRTKGQSVFIRQPLLPMGVFCLMEKNWLETTGVATAGSSIAEPKRI